LRRSLLPRFVRISPSASIDRSVRFLRHHGEIVLGRVTLYRQCELLAPVAIGDGTFVNRNAYIRPETTIGRNVNIGPFVKFLTDGHEIADTGRRAGVARLEPIVVGDGVWIGGGAIILGGVTLHRGAVIGAGSVVTRDVPADTVVAGNPARVIRELEPLRET
jgi:acetyltransferase-like isoleucine patch superfamily enzyme